MTAPELLDRVRADRAAWDALLAQIGEARMSDPGVDGNWSLKDIIAHITFFEREMIGLVRQRALRGSELWQLAQTARNDVIFQQNRDRALRDVLDEARAIYSQLGAALATLSDDDLDDARRFAEMPVEWQPWQIIADNTYEHYRAHIPAVRAWLAARETR
ncbi:MAG: ClbS/DfsB family four-helix bundle protein [Chloroflexi bacterium]|nr:ClbS/DfsB family four-helix bundle protein [Chloroflexota bacterium]